MLRVTFEVAIAIRGRPESWRHTDHVTSAAMLRLGENMSDSREVLVVGRPDTDDDVISSSKPEAAEVGGMTSHPVKSPEDESGASLTVDTPTGDVKLGAAGSKTVNTTVTNNNNSRRPAEASSVPSTSSLQTSANGVRTYWKVVVVVVVTVDL